MGGSSDDLLDEVLPFLEQLAPGLPAGFVYNTIKLMSQAALVLLSLFVVRHLFILARERISSRRFLKRLPLKGDLESLQTDLRGELWGLVEHCAFLGGIVDTHTVRRSGSKRVSQTVYQMSQGDPPVSRALYTAAAMVYDIGFLDVPQPLFHAELFSRKEKELLRAHVAHSLFAFGFVPEKWRRLFRDAGYFHHENYDGSGYPEGLLGDQIPRVARMIRVAESFVSLTSRKAYRKSLSARRAFRELERNAALYDPVMLSRLERVVYKRHGGDMITYEDEEDDMDDTYMHIKQDTAEDMHGTQDTMEDTMDENAGAQAEDTQGVLKESSAPQADELSSGLLERFLRYVAVNTQSDSHRADALIMPSTQGQRKLAVMLADELEDLGLIDVRVTEDSYVYAYLPSGDQSTPPLCLIAHLDTSEEASGDNVKPQVHRGFSGGKITLEGGVVLDTQADRELAKASLTRDTIITSDGTTLLGADDKAGVAEIMSCLEYLVRHPDVRRVGVEVLFTPDEETGHGMDGFPRELVRAKRAYTVDGGNPGELEVECFNAVKTQVSFTGSAAHTGAARGAMVNAIFMASAFCQSLPAHQRAETTDGSQGFCEPIALSGSIEKAHVTLLLRDFTAEGIKRRQEVVELLATAAAASVGGHFEVSHTLQYSNMKEVLTSHPDVVQSLVRAYRACGLEPTFPPIRGGTDGAALCQMGIPCPNMFTGGHNFHSKAEWASLEQMTLATRVLVELCRQV